MFETAERDTDIVRSVALLHVFDREPYRRVVYPPLVRPRHTGVPTPRSDFTKEWLERIRLDGTTTSESTVAELFVFENAKSARKLEVFEWPIQQVDAGGSISFHHAFLLQVVQM